MFSGSGNSMFCQAWGEQQYKQSDTESQWRENIQRKLKNAQKQRIKFRKKLDLEVQESLLEKDRLEKEAIAYNKTLKIYEKNLKLAMPYGVRFSKDPQEFARNFFKKFDNEIKSDDPEKIQKIILNLNRIMKNKDCIPSSKERLYEVYEALGVALKRCELKGCKLKGGMRCQKNIANKFNIDQYEIFIKNRDKNKSALNGILQNELSNIHLENNGDKKPSIVDDKSIATKQPNDNAHDDECHMRRY